MNKKNKSVFYILKKIIKLAMKEEPVSTFINFAVGIILTVCMVLSTLLLQKFFDAILLSFQNKILLTSVIVFFISLGIIRLLSEILNGIQNYMYGIYIDKLSLKFGNLLNRKCQIFGANRYNDMEFLDDIEKAKKGLTNSVELLLVTGDIFTYYGLYFVCMGVYLFSIKPYFILLLLLVFVPSIISHSLKLKTYTALENETALLRRQKNHFADCIKDHNYFKDTRVLNANHYFSKRYYKVTEELNKKQIAVEKTSIIRDSIAKTVTFLGYTGILLILSYALLKGEITAGMFGAIFASISSMFSLMEEMISFHIGRMAEEIATVENFVSIIESNANEEFFNELPLFDSIKLKNVSFHYPNQNKNAINDISISIRAGETVALVGENGSGKSTLSKIIAGLYSPSEGDVIYAQKESENKANSDKINVTALFQNYCKYKLTLHQNIQLGDILNDRNISDTLKMIDAEDIAALDPYEILSTEFGGFDLSGGQWQQVAIARAFYKNAQMVVLDEPTAAIDPLREDKIYHSFKKLLNKKTALIVTHRLGSIRFADRIFVLHEGRIIEQGTHTQLMDKKGKYEKMYLSQANQY